MTGAAKFMENFSCDSLGRFTGSCSIILHFISFMFVFITHVCDFASNFMLLSAYDLFIHLFTTKDQRITANSSPLVSFQLLQQRPYKLLQI